jgi:hypothetical protein
MSFNLLGAYKYKAGPAGGVVTLPSTGKLSTATAYAVAVGATMQIDGGDLIPVPVNGSVAVDVAAGLVSTPAHAIVVAFVGTSGYLVDWFEG